MRKYSVIIFLVVGIVIIGFSCFRIFQKSPVKLSADDIVVMKIHGDRNIVYNRDANFKEIEEFVKAFNKATRCTDDYSTTPNLSVTLTFKNNEKIRVYGGTQGFQTVVTIL